MCMSVFMYRDNPVYTSVYIYIGLYEACGSCDRMNEGRLSHLPFWGLSKGFFLINSTSVGLTRMKRSWVKGSGKPLGNFRRTFHSG